LNRALKYFERKQKKNSLTTIEAEAYLKMLTVKQESLKGSPTISSRRKLVDATDAAYQTKMKSKSQLGQHLKGTSSSQSLKNRDSSASIS